MTFVFCHGFGFDKSFWNNLKPFFKKHTCHYMDLGYFGDAVDVQCANDNLIGIGHSLGLIKLLQSRLKFKALIGLNAFIDFTGGSSKRLFELNAMKKSFAQSPIETLQAFHARCGASIHAQHINKERLFEDLTLLSCRFSVPMGIPVFIIGAQDDVIVPPSVLYNNFDHAKITVMDRGSHALGFLEPEAVSVKIKAIAENSLSSILGI